MKGSEHEQRNIDLDSVYRRVSFQGIQSALLGSRWPSRRFSLLSDGGSLLRSRHVSSVKLPIALFDAASPLVPGNSGADMVWACPFARRGNFLLRLAGCQSKDLIAQV